MSKRILIAFAVCLAVAASAFPQALTSLASVRVGYNTRKNTVKPQGELKAQIDMLDQQIAEATRLGRTGELRRLFAKGLTLLAGREWNDAADYNASLVIRTDRVVADSARPYGARLEQLYQPSIALQRALVAHAELRKRPLTAPGQPAQPGDLVKDLGSFNGVARDLRESPFAMDFDLRDVPDGSYVLGVEVFDEATKLGGATLTIALRKGLDGIVSKLTADAANAPEALRPEILFPVDRIRTVNRGVLELRTFDPDRDLGAAEAIAAAVAAKKDPFAGKTGDFRRHYTLEPAKEILPYRMFVPTTYNGSRAYPLIVALHGLGGTEDAFFDNYNKALPPLAEQHGYIVAGVLGYRVDGSYGWGVGNPPTDPTTRRTQELSEQDVLQVLAQVRQHYKIDDDRIYLIGHSMGAIGAWKIIAKHPEIWAAAATFAGSGAVDTVARFKHIPQFVVHGDNDATVNVNGSRTMVATMKELGVEHRYIEVPGGSHGDVVAPNIPGAVAFFNAHTKSATTPSSAAVAVPLNEMPMKPIMSQVIYPASDAIFYITSREPKTDAEWATLVKKVETLAAASKVMLMPTHRRDRDKWMKDAQLMVDASAAAVEAAKKKDLDRLANLNDALYASCVTCHKDYRPGYGR
jgi:poly(3-hydroxybutyrate) depolymerase